MANTFKFGNGEWAVKEEAALAYNDENNNFKPLPFSFDRGSIATVVNKNGLIETVGVDEPRIDFLNNPKGHLLLEPSRSNLVTYSEDFSNAAWAKINTTITSNDVISPDGSQTADLCNYTTGGSYINTGFASSGNTDVTVSVFVKANTVSVFRIRESFYIGSSCVYDLTAVSAGSGGTIENYGNGWYKCSFTYNLGVGQTNINFIFDLNTNVGSIYLWGAQCELGSYATSYIPTSGSAVTRSAETCNNGGNEQVINSTEGVLYLETKPITDNYSNNGSAFSSQINLSDGNLNNGVNIRFRGANLQCLYYNGSSYQAVLVLIGISVQNYKIAFSYKENEFKMFVNGLLVQQDLTGTIGAFTLSKITFDNSNGVNPFYGNVKDIKVYNTALSDSELIALTTI